MTKRQLQNMSPAETEIFRIIAERGQATIQQIHEALRPDRKVVYKTVLTLVRRLEKKGYVRHKPKGKAHLYLPGVKRDEVVRRSVRDFVDRLFGGDTGPLVQFLAEEGQIDAEEFERLRKIIDRT